MAAPAAACKTHQVFWSVDRVRKAMRGHKHRRPPCQKCMAGMLLNAWECVGHWHWGHRWWD